MNPDRLADLVESESKWLKTFSDEKRALHSTKMAEQVDVKVVMPKWTEMNASLSHWALSSSSVDALVRHRSDIVQWFHSLFPQQAPLSLDKQFLVLWDLSSSEGRGQAILFIHNMVIVLIHSPLPFHIRLRAMQTLKQSPLALPVYVGEANRSTATTLSHENDMRLLERAWNETSNPMLSSALEQTWIETFWFRQYDLKTPKHSFADILEKVGHVTHHKIRLEHWPSDLQQRLAATHRQVRYSPWKSPLEIALVTLHYEHLLLILLQISEPETVVLRRLTEVWFPILVDTTDTLPTEIWAKWLLQPMQTIPNSARQRLTSKEGQALKRDLVQWASLAHLHSIGNLSQMRRSVTLMYYFIEFH